MHVLRRAGQDGCTSPSTEAPTHPRGHRPVRADTKSAPAATARKTRGRRRRRTARNGRPFQLMSPKAPRSDRCGAGGSKGCSPPAKGESSAVGPHGWALQSDARSPAVREHRRRRKQRQLQARRPGQRQQSASASANSAGRQRRDPVGVDGTVAAAGPAAVRCSWTTSPEDEVLHRDTPAVHLQWSRATPGTPSKCRSKLAISRMPLRCITAR